MADSLQQFKLIAGISGDDDDDKVTQLLAFHNNDLNNAISVYFDSKFESLNPPSPPTTSVPEESRLPSAVTDSRQFANLHQQMFLDNFIPKLPKAPKIANHWQLEVGIHLSLQEKTKEEEDLKKESVAEATSPARSLWILLLIIPNRFFLFIFSALKYLLGYNLYGSKGPQNSFPRRFEYDLYSSASILPWVSTFANDEKNVLPYNIHDSNFNELHERTQKEYVWLVVLLVNNNPSSSVFVEHLFSHPTFSKLFNNSTGTYKDTLIYINNVETNPESFEVGQTYNAKKCPYVMLVGNISPNPQQTLNSMSILYKSNLSVTDDTAPLVSRKVLRNLNKLLDQFNPQLITWKLDQQEIEFARAIKQQQDDAYQDSLLRDQIKKSQKHLQQLQKHFLLSLLHQEYAESLLGPDIRLAIKLPHGARHVEKFSSSISVNQLYLYVELKLLAREHENDDIGELLERIELPENVKLTHDLTPNNYYLRYPCNHELVQPFPKHIILNSETLISEVPELKSGANLLVEYKEEESESE